LEPDEPAALEQGLDGVPEVEDEPVVLPAALALPVVPVLSAAQVLAVWRAFPAVQALPVEQVLLQVWPAVEPVAPAGLALSAEQAGPAARGVVAELV